MGELKRGRGRPKKENSKSTVMAFRGDSEDREMMDFICEKEGWTKSEALKQMLKSQYNLSKYRS